jgi:hypothetical protein
MTYHSSVSFVRVLALCGTGEWTILLQIAVFQDCGVSLLVFQKINKTTCGHEPGILSCWHAAKDLTSWRSEESGVQAHALQYISRNMVFGRAVSL